MESGITVSSYRVLARRGFGCVYHQDMEIRPAEPEDALAVARVHVRTWQVAYRGLLPDEYLDQLRAEDRAVRYQFRDLDPLRPWTIVADEAGVIRGFATTVPANQADLPDCGELAALHVDPDHWRRGIGAALVSAARTRLRDLGFRKAMLWVLAGNVRADRFYRTDGWMPDGVSRIDTVWGAEVNELRYQRLLE